MHLRPHLRIRVKNDNRRLLCHRGWLPDSWGAGEATGRAVFATGAGALSPITVGTSLLMAPIGSVLLSLKRYSDSLSVPSASPRKIFCASSGVTASVTVFRSG